MDDSGTQSRIDLTDQERKFLVTALNEWLGPAHPTERMAVALGFDDRQDLFDGVGRLKLALKSSEALGRGDWGRVLAAAEIVFVSDVFGSGCDWRATTGHDDAESIATLRRLQRKLIGHYDRP